jgi:hypothetical protein
MDRGLSNGGRMMVK